MLSTFDEIQSLLQSGRDSFALSVNEHLNIVMQGSKSELDKIVCSISGYNIIPVFSDEFEAAYELIDESSLI